MELCDAVMVARGDLGVEIGDAELPAVQKQLIHQARTMNCVVITATQMMESMISNPIPTRAEVFDVANAVIAELKDSPFQQLRFYTEVFQDGMLEFIEDRDKFAGASATGPE